MEFVVSSTVLLLLVFTFPVSAYPTGPPQEACSNGLRPGPPHGNLTQTGSGGYGIVTDLVVDDNSGGFQYQPNRTYKGMILPTYDALLIIRTQLASYSHNISCCLNLD